MAKKDWEPITLMITPEQKRALQEMSERETASLSFLVRKAIAMFLEMFPDERGKNTK